MPLTKQTIEQDSTDARGPLATALHKRSYKAPGTRAGVFHDWREGSQRGKASNRLARTLRDGR
jgi:hypothetical protein